ncbi:MAG: ThuA domain-containing protein, partial [Rhodothermales bacterium]|nr:ThuA domain-containing protein [Rhodothermales bacterium]
MKARTRHLAPGLSNTLLLLLLSGIVIAPGSVSSSDPQVLVYSKTLGWRHDSIPAGQEAIRQLGRAHGFRVDLTEDATRFTDSTLAGYGAIIFLNTTLDVLDTEGQVALMRYIQAGGGYVGIHSAADTEYDWPWYGQLVGAYFDGHPNNPNVREGIITVVDSSHSAPADLPGEWIRRDEWYDYRCVNPSVNVLLTVDEKSYKRPAEKPDSAPHPIAWYHEFDGGRAFYTGLGHTAASYSEPQFLQHLLGGIRYALGGNQKLNYLLPGVRPHLDRFRKVILEDNLNEPMELDVLPDGRILYVERPGAIRIHDQSAGTTVVAGSLAV